MSERLSRLKSVSTNSVTLTPSTTLSETPWAHRFEHAPAERLHSSLHASLYRPYLDLNKDGDVAIHGEGVLLAFERLVDMQADQDWVQQLHPPAFRSLLAYTLCRPRTADDDPRTALDVATSARARVMVDNLVHVQDLDAARLHALTKLLAALGFYSLILHNLPTPMRRDWSTDADWASYAYLVFSVRANYCTGYSLGTPSAAIAYWPTDLEDLQSAAPPGSRARLDASLRLCVFAGKVLKSREMVLHYARESRAAFRDVDQGTQFHRSLLTSKYLRAVSFEPMVLGDRLALKTVLDEAEHRARSLKPTCAAERVLYRDNLMTVLETRTREAQWNKDLDRAEELVTLSASLNPLDPMRHSVRGEVLAQREKWPEAASAFERAAGLGPPLTPMSYFMAGQCREQMHDLDGALAHYMSCVQVDPGAVSAYHRISVLARRCGIQPLAVMADGIVDRLLSAIPARDGERAEARS